MTASKVRSGTWSLKVKGLKADRDTITVRGRDAQGCADARASRTVTLR